MNISSFYTTGFIAAVVLGMLMLLVHEVRGQELDARVSVNRSQLSGTSLNYLDNLEEELETYINDHSWTTNSFRPEERVGMELQITLLSVDNDYNLEAQLVVRSRRPIYNSRQETLVFMHNDESWEFNYRPNRSLRHDELQFDELTSVIDFYAYLVLGYDFDTFEELGGTGYYRNAQNIVSVAQTGSAIGWTTDSRNSRSQLVNDLLSGRFEPLRQAIYRYHRHGLDLFVDDPEQARANVLEALELIRQVRRGTSQNLLFDLFFNAKYRELVSLFEDAEQPVRIEAYELLSEIDQGHLSEYSKIRN